MNAFTERQRFTQSWLWLLVCIVPAILLVIVLAGSDEVQKELTTDVVVIVGVSGILPLILFLAMRLDTRIDNDGVRYRFIPFHLKERFIPWREIENAFVRSYRPIAEYGGWGIKGGFGNGTAYNVKGNVGLQLQLKSGKKILLGTQKGERITALLENFYGLIPKGTS